jgi:hypothetical protein
VSSVVYRLKGQAINLMRREDPDLAALLAFVLGRVVCEKLSQNNRVNATLRHHWDDWRDGVVQAVDPQTAPPFIAESKLDRSATSRSAMVTGRPRSTRLVTPCCAMPQGTMPS